MARYHASLHTELPCEEAFTYLSDFSTTEEWDPGVLDAARLDTGQLEVGSKFRLTASFLGRAVPLTYEIVEFHPPLIVGFRAESATVISRDRITFEPAGQGTLIGYDADLALKGPLRLADPLLALAFKRVGDRALAGLSEKLRGRVSTVAPVAGAR